MPRKPSLEVEYVREYSKHNDVNDYLASILGQKFIEYRKRWREATSLKKQYDFPLFLAFETMFKCNLKCIMCIHSNKNKQKYEYAEKLPLHLFERVMKEASSYYCPSLTIGGLSEPLMDENLIDMISLARENGFIDIMVNTNATLLTPEVSRLLIRSGLTRLRIGFDALTAETYEKIRVGAKYEKVKNNITRFMEIRGEMGSRLPIVRISSVNLLKNHKELNGFIKYWKPIVDYVAIQMYRPHEITKERLQMGYRINDTTKKFICSNPFERVYIRGNGDVQACCNLLGIKIGNISNNTIYDMWHSKIMNKLRHALKNNAWDEFPKCKECLIDANN